MYFCLYALFRQRRKNYAVYLRYRFADSNFISSEFGCTNANWLQLSTKYMRQLSFSIRN